MENWIFAKLLDTEEWVRVHQTTAGERIFETDRGLLYSVDKLDFTAVHPLDADLLRQFEDNNKRIAEQQVEHQELVNKMLSSMDANAIADHKAKIDEREYWRKLRGDIFFYMMQRHGMTERCLEMTEMYLSQLYYQDKDFFKDK